MKVSPDGSLSKWTPALRRYSRSILSGIGLDQALYARLEPGLQRRPFPREYGVHNGVANVAGPGQTILAQDAFPDRAEFGHGRLAALVARIDPELDTHRAAVEGVVQHQQFRLRIGSAAADIRMQKRRPDFDTALALKPGIIGRHPDHTIIAASADRVGHSLAERRAAGRGPIGIKAVAHRVDRHDRPGIRVAVHCSADLRFEIGCERLKTQESPREGDISEPHAVASVLETSMVLRLKAL